MRARNLTFSVERPMKEMIGNMGTLGKIKLYLALHIFLMIYATSGIFSKLAAREEFLSIPFILLYGTQLFLLAFYAVGWQQFIKRMPLSAAYANKAVSVIWGCVWGVMIFHEHLTAGKLAGGLLVLSGIALYGYADGRQDSEKPTDQTDHANLTEQKEIQDE